MAYQIEQTIKGRIYLYEVESYWDKEKKQARQKRKYLGPKERIYKKLNDKTPKSDNNSNNSSENLSSTFISKNYGNVYVNRQIQNKIGLTDLLKQYFNESYKDILALSSFMFEESSASYLYHFWHVDHYLPSVNKLYSKCISSLYDLIGRKEFEISEFMKSWCNHIKPTSGVYYDITSISSYSENNQNIEWGYNRDKEYLPQINIGFTYCQKTSLPLSYRIHPGSIVDVSTLKNTIKIFESYNLKNLFFILDRGFCSISNIKEMYTKKMGFIQPLSFSLNKAKELLIKNKSRLSDSMNAFEYKKEILYHVKDQIELDKVQFNAHIYYNEKSGISFKHHIYGILLELEIKHKLLERESDCKKYLEEKVPLKYQKYYRIESKKILRNNTILEEEILKAGSIIFILNGKDLTKEDLLSSYRNRDKIEKEIDKLKNHIDCKRLRSHNEYTSKGRLFIKFISMIQSSEIMQNLKKDEKLKRYSLKEVMLELKKLKITSLDGEKSFLSELTKKQKKIFKCLNIKLSSLEELPSY